MNPNARSDSNCRDQAAPAMRIDERDAASLDSFERDVVAAKEPIIDMASTPEEEYTMRLGPNLVEQFKRKIDTMNAHWRDYDRIFTVPNL